VSGEDFRTTASAAPLQDKGIEQAEGRSQSGPWPPMSHQLWSSQGFCGVCCGCQGITHWL